MLNSIRSMSYQLLPGLWLAAMSTYVTAASPGENCVQLVQHSFPASMQLAIRHASLNNADGFCLVQGEVNSRQGDDGKHYGIGFEMRLPLSWNGRFVYQMNGGNEGTVVAAEGDASNLNAFGGRSARARGYAVLSTNGGHAGDDPANQQYGLAAGNRFGLDPQAREDYGYRTTVIMAPVAKAIMQAVYAKQPAYSYLTGCSNGGRQGMVAASRYGDMFNGILVGAPGFNLPKAALQHAWDIQSAQQLDPKVHNAFSRADLKLVANQVLAQCDAQDGIADGLVNNIRQCQRVFSVDSLSCADKKTDTCLSEKQVQVLKRIMAGPRNSKGEALYSSWWYDTGMADEGWRFWKLESPIPAWDNNPLIATMGAGALAYIFTTPATQVEGSPQKLLQFLSEFDFDRDAPKIFAAQPPAYKGDYKKSAMEFMTPPDAANPTLEKFRAHKAKLIIYQGQSDPVFSTVDIVDWYEKLNKNTGYKADTFARLFVIPGMNHCGGGPATDQFDGLDALVKWVEQGAAPTSITATVNDKNTSLPSNWSTKRTRPLCAWPAIARYKAGDSELAQNFVCTRD